jgi:hypothetical protein
VRHRSSPALILESQAEVSPELERHNFTFRLIV